MRDRGNGVRFGEFCSRAWRCSLLFQFVWFVVSTGPAVAKMTVWLEEGGFALHFYTNIHTTAHSAPSSSFVARDAFSHVAAIVCLIQRYSKCCAHTVICQTFFLSTPPPLAYCCRPVSFVAPKTVATDRASHFSIVQQRSVGILSAHTK